MLDGILDEAQSHSNRIAQFLVRDAQDDPERQAADIDALLDERIDLLVISCTQGRALEAALARTVGAGIPVVAVDRRPMRPEHFLTYVSASDITLGRVTAQWMVEKLSGEGSIFMLAGIQGSSPAELRIAAAMEVFAEYSDIRIVATRYTDWREEVGRAVTADLLTCNGVPDGVWCDSGLQGAGAIQAFLDFGLDSVPPHTGGDVNKTFQLATHHHIPLAAVEYPAWMGARALQAGLDVLDGKPLPRQIEVRSQVVVSRGEETCSVLADVFVEDYVRWDRALDFVASNGMGDRIRHSATVPA
jgi:ribose transport system substrate-binding protein